MLGASSIDWLPAVPTPFLVVAAVVGFVFALVALAAAVDPGTRRQLRFVARQTGAGWGIGLALVVVATVSFGSVFVLGGTTTGRYDYPLAFAFLAHVAGLFLLGDAAGTLPRYLAVRRAPRRDAASVEPGERVAVDGEAVAAADPLEAPFSGEAALCYELRVMERRGDSDRAVNAEELGVGGNWRPEYVDEAGVTFDVADGTGSLAVVPDSATLDLEETTEITVALEDDLPQRIREFLTDNLVEVGFGAHDRRYVEAALGPGDRVTVVGPVVTAGDAGTRPVVDAREGDCTVASQGVEGFQSKLRRRVTAAAGGGLALTVLGYAATLVVAGAV